MKNLICTILALFLTSTASAYDFQANGVYYNFLGNDSVEVTKGNGKYYGNVTIPASVSYSGQTYVPTRIGDDAFSGCSITSLTFEDGTKIRDIGNCAFMKAKFTKTDSFVMPVGLQTIGDSAFFASTGLQAVVLGNEVVEVGQMAFAYAEMKSLNIGKGLDVKGIQFAACYPSESVGLDSENPYVVLEDGVVYSNDKTRLIKSFNNEEAGNIGDIKQLTTIGAYAFYGDEQLKGITIPEGVTRIEERAFEHCEQMQYMVFPTTLRNVAKLALNCCLGYSGNNTSKTIKRTGVPVYYIFKSDIGPSFVGKQYVKTPQGVCIVPTTTKTKYFTLYTKAFANYYLLNFQESSLIFPITTYEDEDVNHDGSVNSLDVLKVYKYMQSH